MYYRLYSRQVFSGMWKKYQCFLFFHLMIMGLCVCFFVVVVLFLSVYNIRFMFYQSCIIILSHTGAQTSQLPPIKLKDIRTVLCMN